MDNDSLPAGITHLYGAMYLVPFEAISMAEGDDEDTDKYSFKNPRALTESGQAKLMDKEASECLREDIKERTLMAPFICRWTKKNGIVPQLVGGDRRYRAVDYLRQHKVLVKDASTAKMNDDGDYEYESRPADLVYEKVLCQIYSADDDLDALGYAYSENNCRENLTDGHDVAIVQELRRCRATDEKILSIMRKDARWLRDTDKLIAELDDDSLKDLLENRIDRDSAKSLLEIEDLETRTKIREEANAESAEESKKRKQKYQKRVSAALEEEELAAAKVASAESSGDEEAIAAASATLEEKSQKVERTVAERNKVAVPVTGKKHVAAATKVVTGEDPTDKRALRTPKIQEFYVDYLKSVLENDCQDEENGYTSEPDLIKFGLAIAEGIMQGDTDCVAICKKYAAME